MSYGGSLLDSSLFVPFQANLMWSAGGYIGVGAGLQGGAGKVPAGVNTSTVAHVEGNLGAGLSGGFTVDIPLDGDGVAVGGSHGKISMLKAGLGIGAALGVGIGKSTTIGRPTLAIC